MKKSLMVLVLSMVAGAANANVVEIENKSDYKLEGSISLTGISCGGSVKSLNIQPRSTVRVSSKDCCAGVIRLSSAGYKGSGKPPYDLVKGDSWGVSSSGTGLNPSVFKTSGQAAGELVINVAAAGANIRLCGAKEKFVVTVKDASALEKQAIKVGNVGSKMFYEQQLNSLSKDELLKKAQSGVKEAKDELLKKAQSGVKEFREEKIENLGTVSIKNVTGK